MGFRFAPGTSDEARNRLTRALEIAARNPQQRSLVEEVAPAVQLKMSADLPPHVRFQLDPVDQTLSVNANVEQTDEQMSEGIVSRLVLARQLGLAAQQGVPQAAALSEKPQAAGALSRTWNAAVHEEAVPQGAKPQVSKKPAL